MAQSIEKIRLIDMMRRREYQTLADDLIRLPVPSEIQIGRRHYRVPKDMNEFTKAICYGQRIFFAREEENDYGVIIRTIDGYYYPIATGEKWDQDKALLFGRNVINCAVVECYPVAMHLVKMIGEMVEREQKLLHREVKQIERAAGIERLNKFAELSALNFLRDEMKITIPEVLLTPYNECLVRFMHEKEVAEYHERYMELQTIEAQSKMKKHGRSTS